MTAKSLHATLGDLLTMIEQARTAPPAGLVANGDGAHAAEGKPN